MRHRLRPTRLLRLLPAGALVTMLLGVAPAGAAAATLDVCQAGCTYAQLAPAIAAAADGGTVRVGPGTYAGGITIDKGLRLVGAGTGRTVIKGGGPVITIGTFGATRQPTVLIEGVTIRDGVTHSSLVGLDWGADDGVIALGGGVEILPNADYSAGGTVTIRNSDITGNKALPNATMPWGPPCPGGPCTFAWAKGGGIDNWGALTLIGSTVSDNLAAGLASDANGGGINTWWTGSLAVHDSAVNDNRAIASAPNGRFAEGGGIFTDGGIGVSIRDSSVSGNTARLTSTLPFHVGGDTLDMNANGGGIHVGDGSTVSIIRSHFDRNRVDAIDPNGEPYAFDAAVHPGDGPLTIRDTTIDDNRLILDAASSADVGPSGSVLDILGPASVRGIEVTGNVVSVTSRDGLAWASAAVYAGDLGSTPAVISGSVIADNVMVARSHGGPAVVIGGGIVNEGLLVLRGDRISDNTAAAYGPSGSAQGGGVWNGSVFPGNLGVLTMDGTFVTGNVLAGSAGVTLQGGGVYSVNAVTVHGGAISGNQPDDCVGC